MDAVLMPLMKACKEADVVLSVTGVRHTIRKEHFKVLKDNAHLANAGHFWEEIDSERLSGMSKDRKQLRRNVEGFLLQDGRWTHEVVWWHLASHTSVSHRWPCLPLYPCRVHAMQLICQVTPSKHEHAFAKLVGVAVPVSMAVCGLQ